MVLTLAQEKDQGKVAREKDLGKVMAVNTKILIDNNLFQLVPTSHRRHILFSLRRKKSR